MLWDFLKRHAFSPHRYEVEAGGVTGNLVRTKPDEFAFTNASPYPFVWHGVEYALSATVSHFEEGWRTTKLSLSRADGDAKKPTASAVAAANAALGDPLGQQASIHEHDGAYLIARIQACDFLAEVAKETDRAVVYAADQLVREATNMAEYAPIDHYVEGMTNGPAFRQQQLAVETVSKRNLLELLGILFAPYFEVRKIAEELSAERYKQRQPAQ